MLVAFEGHDGVGKSTVVQCVGESLKEANYRLEIVRNPTPLFQELRSKVDASADTELAFKFSLMSSLYALVAARSEMLHSGVDVVLMDRYVYSTIVSFRLKGYDPVPDLWSLFPKPDLAFWITVDEAIRRKRVLSRDDVKEHDKRSLDLELIRNADELYASFGMIQVDNSHKLSSATCEVLAHLLVNLARTKAY